MLVNRSSQKLYGENSMAYIFLVKRDISTFFYFSTKNQVFVDFSTKTQARFS